MLWTSNSGSLLDSKVGETGLFLQTFDSIPQRRALSTIARLHDDLRWWDSAGKVLTAGMRLRAATARLQRLSGTESRKPNLTIETL